LFAKAETEVYARERVPTLRGRERRDRLGRIALKATGGVEPTRMPFYVHPNDVGDATWMIAPGWYWQAPSALFPTYLGYNSTRAEVALLTLAEQHRTAS
jgi:hypothetical protein